MREFSVRKSFTVDEHENAVESVFTHEAADPDYVIVQRLVDGAWTDVTCAQVAERVRSTARGLIAEGVQPGDRVAILSATRYEWAIIDFAILSIGAVTVPIYETSSAEQVRFVLADSGAVAAFAETDEHFERVDRLKPELPELRHVYRIDGTGPAALDELARIGADTDPAAVSERLDGIEAADVATLVYTSGTTGRPKGCQLTHSNLLHEMRGAKACFPALLDQGERLLVFLPLAHVLARSITMSAFSNKVTVGFTSDVKNLVATLAVFKPTLVVSVPRVFEKVYNTAEQNARDGGKAKVFAAAADTAIAWSQARDTGGQERSDTGKKSGGQERSDTGKKSGGQERSDTGKKSGGGGLVLNLKHALFDRLVYGKLRAALGGNCRAAISGGAPLGVRLGHFYRGVGLTIYEGYGLTETSSAITVNRVGDVKIGSVGKLLPGNAMRLGDDDELLVSGAVVFSGYWHNQSETDAAISDGWFHTGDLGAIDDDGFLTIVGRKKEIIVTAGGKNVAPALLEDRLRAHPLISQALVVGDAQPFIAALITIDPEAFGGWKQRNGKDPSASVGDLAEDPTLIGEIDTAVQDANQAVSHAESIRKFRILPVDFTEETGELTPTLKVKRKVVVEKFADDVHALYATSGD